MVGQPQSTAVIGHFCSSGFRPALPIYEAAGVVTISGSATASDLPGLAPTVFNRTAVPDPDFDPW
jgi:ABC-type branched-subunit amino acid transport system substrate-binding protein